MRYVLSSHYQHLTHAKFPYKGLLQYKHHTLKVSLYYFIEHYALQFLLMTFQNRLVHCLRKAHILWLFVVQQVIWFKMFPVMSVKIIPFFYFMWNLLSPTSVVWQGHQRGKERGSIFVFKD